VVLEQPLAQPWWARWQRETMILPMKQRQFAKQQLMLVQQQPGACLAISQQEQPPKAAQVMT
jgi:hypothetical protein